MRVIRTPFFGFGIALFLSALGWAAEPPPPPTNALNLAAFGAKGDGITDNQLVLQRGIDTARSQGRRCYLPAGNYVHDGALTIMSQELFGDGPSTVLIASNPLNEAIYMRGTNPSLHHLAVTARRGNTTRQGMLPNHMVVMFACSGFTVDHVHVSQGSAAGIFNYGSAGGSITNNSVEDTLADGIHNTNAASGTIITGNHVRNVGDDMIAVVSYASEKPCHDITIIANNVAGNFGGRGITCIGGNNVTITSNTIVNTWASGVAAYGENETLGVDNVLIQNNTIIGSCTGSCVTYHPGILLGGRAGGIVQNVRADHNTVTNSTNQAIRIDNQYVQQSSITNNIISGYSEGAIVAPAGVDVTVSGNDVIERSDQKPLDATTGQ
jgi:hypothetical protein